MKGLGKGEDKAYKSLGRPEDRDEREGISRRESWPEGEQGSLETRQGPVSGSMGEVPT